MASIMINERGVQRVRGMEDDSGQGGGHSLFASLLQSYLLPSCTRRTRLWPYSECLASALSETRIYFHGTPSLHAICNKPAANIAVAKGDDNVQGCGSSAGGLDMSGAEDKMRAAPAGIQMTELDEGDPAKTQARLRSSNERKSRAKQIGSAVAGGYETVIEADESQGVISSARDQTFWHGISLALSQGRTVNNVTERVHVLQAYLEISRLIGLLFDGSPGCNLSETHLADPLNTRNIIVAHQPKTAKFQGIATFAFFDTIFSLLLQTVKPSVVGANSSTDSGGDERGDEEVCGRASQQLYKLTYLNPIHVAPSLNTTPT
ncbi:hypothetical protein EDD16DRAFT_1526905 [Pisolithus croceorrhizus]|nr:hypothetical protein EDD16DRAFT_1526905 [Pisolithus croceorrhizus]